MITLKARFDGHVLVPQSPLRLPAGCEVEISLTPLTPTASAERPLTALAEVAQLFPDSADYPADATAQHDHYLYGLPKRP